MVCYGIFWSGQYNCYSAKKKTMCFIGVEVEQETSAPPPKKNPGSTPVLFPVDLVEGDYFCMY